MNLGNIHKNNLCLIFLCLNKIYQNLILYIPDYINQFYRHNKKQSWSVQVSHSAHRNTCPHSRCSFDTLTLLNVLNLSIENAHSADKNTEYWHCCLRGLWGHSLISVIKSGWIHAEQSRKCTWTLPPGTDLKGQTETVIPHAKTIYHEQGPHLWLPSAVPVTKIKFHLPCTLAEDPLWPLLSWQNPSNTTANTLSLQRDHLGKLGSQVWELSCTAPALPAEKPGKDNKILGF